MKGSPPTAGREYGEEWAPCVKGGIFLLSEKNRLFLSIEEKNPESAKNTLTQPSVFGTFLFAQ